MPRKPAWADLDDSARQVYVQLEETGRMLVVGIDRMRTVGDLRRCLARRLSVHVDDFWLYYRGCLRNHHTLRDIGITEGSAIELFSTRSGILGA